MKDQSAQHGGAESITANLAGDDQGLSPNLRKLLGVLWAVGVALLIGLGFARFFEGTYFAQDDFVWLCFCKYYPEPVAILWRDTLCQQFFRPIGEFWWLGIHAVAGNQVWAYQVGFLAVHLLNGFLAARLASRVIGGGIGRHVGIVFTLSPLFVMGIATRYHFIFDTLGFSFYVLSLLCLSLSQAKRPVLYGLLSLLAALLSYHSKEAYYTLPGAAILVLGVSQQGMWSWSGLRGRWRWFALHVLVWAAALGWRTAVIGQLGGYGLASIHDLGDLGQHLGERARTWLDFAGWSVAPFLTPRPENNSWRPLGDLLVLGGLTLAAAIGTKNWRGVLWSWGWMLIVWTPSLTMTTYAPVSWYASSFGTAALVGLACERWDWSKPLTLLLGLYLSLSSWSFYTDETHQQYMKTLRLQHAELEQLFPRGGSTKPPGTCYFLIGTGHDLYPDPIIKYHTPPGEPMADVLFINPKAPVAWVVTNDQEPTEYRPLTVSLSYQSGYMDLGNYRAYVLSFQPHLGEVLQTGPPRFRFLQWKGKELEDVTELVMRQAHRLSSPQTMPFPP